MTSRHRLANRRAHETIAIDHEQQRYKIGLGRELLCVEREQLGPIVEVFLSAQKVNSPRLSCRSPIFPNRRSGRPTRPRAELYVTGRTPMSTHIQVPLKNLRFGHEAPNHPSNARVTGRLDGIEALAANIHSRGLIEDLVVFDDGVPDIWFVSDGNRSLAALRLIYGEESSELIDCKPRPADGAFEDSLAVAVMGRKLHPIDEYEGFARLRDDHGKTEAEIAHQYGLAEREVQQVLALGGLSPKVREAWRNGELKASAAKAFTLADHKRQDEVLDRLRSEAGGEYGRVLIEVEDDDVKEILEIDQELGVLVEFVGVDAYVARGGKVTRDLFGSDHQVSDAKLARKMADERLSAECDRLVKSGWGWAVTRQSVKNTYWNYSSLKAAESKPSEEEQRRLDELDRITSNEEGYRLRYFDMNAAQQRAFHDRRALIEAIELRGFLPKAMAKAGCFVEIDDDGFLKVEYGKVKPAQKETAARVEKEERQEKKKADTKAAKTAGQPAPEPTELSGALKDRLDAQLVAGTLDAIAACLETDELGTPLAQILGKLVLSQVKVNGSVVSCYSHGTREKLPAMREAMPAAIVNAKIAARFDAEDYFGSAPKGFVIKAIAEAINPDEARKAAQGSKRELAVFATKNLKGSGWVPKELRTLHYKAPVVKASAPAAAPPAGAAKAAETRRPTVSPAMRTALSKAKKALAKSPAAKRAAAAKKSAKKISKQKR